MIEPSNTSIYGDQNPEICLNMITEPVLKVSTHQKYIHIFTCEHFPTFTEILSVVLFPCPTQLFIACSRTEKLS